MSPLHGVGGGPFVDPLDGAGAAESNGLVWPSLRRIEEPETRNPPGEAGHMPAGAGENSSFATAPEYPGSSVAGQLEGWRYFRPSISSRGLARAGGPIFPFLLAAEPAASCSLRHWLSWPGLTSSSAAMSASGLPLSITRCRLGLILAGEPPPGSFLCHSILLGCSGSLQNPPLHRCCWRIRRIQAGCAMSRTKVDWRVRASGVPASQAATRTRLRAAAVSTCWRWTFARPM